MKREDLTFQTGFRVSVGKDHSQGAVMVLANGRSGPKFRQSQVEVQGEVLGFAGAGRNGDG
jgi:hypothetical protein